MQQIAKIKTSTFILSAKATAIIMKEIGISVLSTLVAFNKLKKLESPFIQHTSYQGSNFLLLSSDNKIHQINKTPDFLSIFSNNKYNKCIPSIIMRCFFKKCDMATNGPTKIYDITDEIINYVAESRIKNGHMIIKPLHTTVGIYINEEEKGLLSDFEKYLDNKVPPENGYLHDDIENREDCPNDEPINCHSHIKSAFFSNPSVSLIIFGGQLQLGKYQRLLFAEFDGPCPRKHKSRRRYAVSIIGA